MNLQRKNALLAGVIGLIALLFFVLSILSQWYGK